MSVRMNKSRMELQILTEQGRHRAGRQSLRQHERKAEEKPDLGAGMEAEGPAEEYQGGKEGSRQRWGEEETVIHFTSSLFILDK